VSAVRLDTLLSPEQQVLGEIAAEELRRFRHAVKAEADVIDRVAARTDADPVMVDAVRFDTAPTSYIDEDASNRKTRRNDSMGIRNDANEHLDSSHAATMNLDNSPDDRNDPVVRARAQRDKDAADMWRSDASPGENARRDDLRQRIGDPGLTREEIAEIVRMRGGDQDLSGMPAAGIREMLTAARKKFADVEEQLAPVENTDADDEDGAIERARAQRDADARDAWKAGGTH